MTAAGLEDLRLYTAAEAAEALGVTETWLLKQLRERSLPGRKVARSWKLTRGDIAEAIEIMARPATAPRKDPAGLTRRARHNLTRRTR